MGEPVKRIKKNNSHLQHMVLDGNTRSGPSSTDLHFNFRNQIRQPRNGSYPIHIALSNNATFNVISLLLKSVIEGYLSEPGNMLLLQNKYGATPLHLALLNNLPNEITNLLLSFNNEAMKENALAVKDNDGNLPLHYALIGECANDIIQTIANGYPNAMLEKNNYGKTPFQFAEEDKSKVMEKHTIDNTFKKNISTAA